ncbi:hypothetical protein C1645_840837 [Glomus cerebriforme]|uniref:Uncharacterized protein n=1 Tax=Glomus cerebriforme TaxID=658196 RepID=A0A397S5W7_9GLOM|nr:hypothetical protein C1645_840837 [Glomus cerebriforme]
MSCTLTVIGLITRLRVSNQITNGDTIYREKVSNQTHMFGLKQFTNARHEYNEQFKEGDLLLVKMARVIEPKIGPNDEYLKWKPTEIILTKPFVNIFTTATEPLSIFENMNFVKTQSLIYTPFHSIAKYINFEIDYQKDSKWLESITEKWKDYANVKLINYDVRFYQSNTSNQSITSLTNQSISVFMMRRNKSASPSTPKLSSTNTITMNDYIPNSRNLIKDTDSIAIDDNESASQSVTLTSNSR